MLAMKIEIDDKHIKEAESIFIGGKPFDEERINFIKNSILVIYLQFLEVEKQLP